MAKKFYDLKLGSMSMKELSSKFLSLLRYIPYIIDENPKIQRFLSCLPLSFKDIIEYDNPKTLEEAMRKANLCFEQGKNKREGVPKWKGKLTNNFEQRRKGFKSNRNFGNDSQNYSKNTYQGTDFKSKRQHDFTASKNKDMPNNYVKNNEQREPVKCWECQGPHYAKGCPNRKRNFSNVHTIHEEAIVGDIVNEMPRINVALENHHDDHQTSMVEIEGMIKNYPYLF